MLSAYFFLSIIRVKIDSIKDFRKSFFLISWVYYFFLFIFPWFFTGNFWQKKIKDILKVRRKVFSAFVKQKKLLDVTQKIHRSAIIFEDLLPFLLDFFHEWVLPTTKKSRLKIHQTELVSNKERCFCKYLCKTYI